MQVSITKLDKFKPVTLNIVLESSAEYDSLWSLAGWNYAVADFIDGHDVHEGKDFDKQTLDSMLSKIFQVLKEKK